MDSQTISPQAISQLVQKAAEARQHSYAPYSNFRVGAALLLSDGSVVTGCNVENAAYGLSNCAERTAIFKAVSEGRRDFAAIAIVGSSAELCAPCGACRQVMAEFHLQMPVIMAEPGGQYKVMTVAELLPEAFVLEKEAHE